MSNFKADNPFQRLNLSLEALSCLSEITFSSTIRPEYTPLLLEVEAVREKGAPVTAPQVATRYNIVFPGSGFLRIAIKVDEPIPSITQEAIERAGGMVRVNIEGFFSGTFLTDDGGIRPYFKAARVAPVTAAQAAPVGK